VKDTKTQTEPVTVARVGEHQYVIRLHGRGNIQCCGGLKQFFERQFKRDPDSEIILDMGDCATMDSTFMGVLAGAGLHVRETHRGRLVLMNLNPHTQKLLRTLGLIHFLEISKSPPPAADSQKFEPLTESKPMSKLDRIRMMIEAHEKLVDVDQGNEIKFQNVLDYLNESLARAEGAGDPGAGPKS
jgi:anti-anti-sigma factor